MSLFDVIKYPITDILDPDQVDVLPTNILVPWLEESVDFLDVDWPISNTNLYSAASVITVALINKANKLGDYIRPADRDDHIRMWKYYLTMRLKQRIRDYGIE